MRSTVATLVLLVCLAIPATAPARVVVGMGDQKPTMFTDDRFHYLGLRQARIVVSWDVQRTPRERTWMANWLTEARRARVEPLVAFGHAWSGPRRKHLPTPRAFRLAFQRFRRAYPWVRAYTPWNEANHCSQPTCKRPERAAAYYDVIRSACPRCTVVAADVLDQPNMVRWLQRFRRAARHRPRIWGLHNYLDANRLRTSGTRRLLRAVKGDVWITETGGVVRRKHYRAQIAFPESPEHAAKVTRHVLRFAKGERRIRRVYLYQWNADSLTQVWDSGIIDPFGLRRPAYAELARHLGRDPGKAPPDPVFGGEAPLPPEVQPPPGADQPGPPPPPPPPPKEEEPAPPPPEDEPEPDCSLIVVCPPPGVG
jgi:hypothetical protein